MAKESVKIEVDMPTYFSTQSSNSSASSSITELNIPPELNTKIDVVKNSNMNLEKIPHEETVDEVDEVDEIDGRRHGRRTQRASTSYAASKNVAEGMMDIALLSANANQLRFLITYNSEASTYYISLGLIILSLVMQVSVGIALIFKHRWRRGNCKRFARTNEFLVGGVFMVTVVNILLAAFTTTDGQK